ncbi:NAD(P)H-binding protein [Allosaccharopolyspora coralli]|uniref:NAD(P)H-binding protein n=1 Tax=Allosaccharopolyspora coralli TaxID=2665642 RepID=A0A5Q3QEV5_9PSEU|nr:NAD(P)H-binding protein [Allosaccharopolyspora coralli]QGK69989.1 NAD(P)H-binding protein [Allosaccharopolyspora coralli]
MIVVTTPTGRVGSRVVRLLVQAGVRPRVLLRDPNTLDAAIRAEVDVVQSDLTDAESVVRGTRGADSLFWVNPATQDDDPVAAHAHLGANAARAVVDNGIPRTVFLSSLGAEKRSGAGDIDGLGRTEELLDATGASVVHLRCGYFFSNLLMELDGLRAGVLGTPWPLDHAMPWVDPRDIGDVAAARLLADRWTGRVVQAVHGPADLTFRQVAAILTRVLDRSVTPAHLAQHEFRAGLHGAGLSAKQVEAVAGMSEGLSGGFVPENKRSVRTTTPTTLAAWAQTELAPVL